MFVWFWIRLFVRIGVFLSHTVSLSTNTDLSAFPVLTIIHSVKVHLPMHRLVDP